MTEKTIEHEEIAGENTSLATSVYALQAVSFLLGVTYLAAVVLNYAKLDSVTGT